MKRLSLAILTAALASGAFATVNSTNTFAQMSVTSANAWTLLALPWVTPGSEGSQNIVVTNLVLTTGLSDGDLLMHLTDTANTYEIWTVSGGKWVAASSVSESGITKAPDPKTASFPRGIGVWLKRSSTDSPILLYGQVKSDDYGSVEVPANSTALVACPRATDLDLSGWDVGNTNDYIRVSSGSANDVKEYYRSVPPGGNALKWCTMKTSQEEVEILGQKIKETYISYEEVPVSTVIKSGLGFLYKNAAAEKLTIEW